MNLNFIKRADGVPLYQGDAKFAFSETPPKDSYFERVPDAWAVAQRIARESKSTTVNRKHLIAAGKHISRNWTEFPNSVIDQRATYEAARDGNLQSHPLYAANLALNEQSRQEVRDEESTESHENTAPKSIKDFHFLPSRTASKDIENDKYWDERNEKFDSEAYSRDYLATVREKLKSHFPKATPKEIEEHVNRHKKNLTFNSNGAPTDDWYTTFYRGPKIDEWGLVKDVASVMVPLAALAVVAWGSYKLYKWLKGDSKKKREYTELRNAMTKNPEVRAAIFDRILTQPDGMCLLLSVATKDQIHAMVRESGIMSDSEFLRHVAACAQSKGSRHGTRSPKRRAASPKPVSARRSPVHKPVSARRSPVHKPVSARRSPALSPKKLTLSPVRKPVSARKSPATARKTPRTKSARKSPATARKTPRTKSVRKSPARKSPAHKVVSARGRK
jgi:hypothetical protein